MAPPVFGFPASVSTTHGLNLFENSTESPLNTQGPLQVIIPQALGHRVGAICTEFVLH